MTAVLAFAGAAQASVTWTVDAGGGGDYMTIQAAIDAATTLNGDTINVSAGAYDGFNVTKAIMVDGISGYASTIINGVVNLNAAATVKGFTIGTASQGAYMAADGAVFDSCWIESTGTSATTHTIQIYPEYGSGAKNVTIRNSTIKTNTLGKAAIYVETRGLLDGLTLDNNTIIGDYGLTQSFGALNTTITDNSFTGISGGTKRAIQIKTSMDNVLIEDNDITGFAIGIRLDNNLVGIGPGPVVVTGNTIWDNSTENMQIKRAPNLQITNNEFSQSTSAPNIHIYGSYGDLDIDFINYNNIIGDVGIQNDSTTTVDALYNWWGDASGPTHSENPGGIGASVTDYVDYGDFLQTPIPEPATMSLLALGGLALIRRRRRLA